MSAKTASAVIKAPKKSKDVDRYPVAPEELNIATIRAAIPREMFKQDTVKSLLHMLWDITWVAAFHYAMSTVVSPLLDQFTASPIATANPLLGTAVSFVVWNAFWFFQGLNFTALWVLAHEAGHGGFSASKVVNELVGFVLHSALLVPYHSWRVSHGTHHKYTNHMTMDTVFVPAEQAAPLKEAIVESPIVATLKFLGMMTLGWPLYLIANIAGQTNWGGKVDKTRRVNHFEPSSPLFKKSDKWAVIVSNVGMLGVLALVAVAVQQVGLWTVAAYYGVPYFWTNAWLVYITYMQHSDIRVPHYDDKNFNFVRGALCSIDRDYGFVNSWLHHINDSHVVHHLFHDMPFYNAIEVTNKFIKPVLGKYYASDDRSMLTQTIESWTQCLYVVPTEGITYFRH